MSTSNSNPGSFAILGFKNKGGEIWPNKATANNEKANES